MLLIFQGVSYTRIIPVISGLNSHRGSLNDKYKKNISTHKNFRKISRVQTPKAGKSRKEKKTLWKTNVERCENVCVCVFVLENLCLPYFLRYFICLLEMKMYVVPSMHLCIWESYQSLYLLLSLLPVLAENVTGKGKLYFVFLKFPVGIPQKHEPIKAWIVITSVLDDPRINFYGERDVFSKTSVSNIGPRAFSSNEKSVLNFEDAQWARMAKGWTKFASLLIADR